jgi:hypothetical protein
MTQNPFIKIDLHDSTPRHSSRSSPSRTFASRVANAIFIRDPRPGVLRHVVGYRSYSAIAEWGRNYGTDIAQALGFTHSTPCAATLHTIFRCIDREAFEAKVGAGRRVWWRRRQRPEAPESP